MDPALADWLVSQPLGIAVLIAAVVGFTTGRIVTGSAYKREQDRADRLAETVTVLTKAVERSAETGEKALAATQLVHSLIQGIDSALRTQRGP